MYKRRRENDARINKLRAAKNVKNGKDMQAIKGLSKKRVLETCLMEKKSNTVRFLSFL